MPLVLVIQSISMLATALLCLKREEDKESAGILLYILNRDVAKGWAGPRLMAVARIRVIEDHRQLLCIVRVESDLVL